MRVLVTGCAGFIGYHAAQRLLERGDSVLGMDNLNSYYSVDLKRARLAQLVKDQAFRFMEADICNQTQVASATIAFRPDVILHLAAQAGVRYSIENPIAYIEANVVGQVSIFEAAASFALPLPVVFASSSSVYGNSKSASFSEVERVDAPASIYAASKRSGELIAGVYASIHGVRSIGLRFFTVYGRFGRPDMAPWLFTDAVLSGRPISVFNGGTMERDFTHVSDIVSGVVEAVDRILEPHAEVEAVYNLGNNRPARVLDLIAAIEDAADREAVMEMRPGPPGEAFRTCANIDRAARDLNFAPRTSLTDGIADFVGWFRDTEAASYGKVLQDA